MSISHVFRFKNTTKTANLTPIRAVRYKCLQCANWNNAEVRRCHIEDCPLWPFRLGEAHTGRKPIKEMSQKAILRAEGGLQKPL